MTYKVQEAAADFMMSVRLGLEQLFHHGQEVFVNGQNLLDVGEQNLREKKDKQTLCCHKTHFISGISSGIFSSHDILILPKTTGGTT